jgi:3-dehydroquinate synthase
LKTDELKLNLAGGRGYPISIGAGASKTVAGRVSSLSRNCRAFIVTDKNVARAHLEPIAYGLKSAKIDFYVEILPPGEKQKNFNTYKRLIGGLAALDDTRDLVVIALGGGVVGDLAGFAAATDRRGVPLIHMPTTLLACVDSSVGGKTGIDLPEGKNLVGSFYQPRAVIIDTDFLTTLPKRELRCGVAEVIKYGFIMDAPFAGRLEKNMEKLLDLDRDELGFAIKRCCALKAKTVTADERDEKGVRAILNFGHTFAHAIETARGYGRYRHGEAVAVGMICAAELSMKLGLLDESAVERIEKLIACTGLPTQIEDASPDELIKIMVKDKKTRAGKLRFILIDRIGHAFISDAPLAADVRAVLKKRIK